MAAIWSRPQYVNLGQGVGGPPCGCKWVVSALLLWLATLPFNYCYLRIQTNSRKKCNLIIVLIGVEGNYPGTCDSLGWVFTFQVVL